MTQRPQNANKLRVANLSVRRPVTFDLAPDARDQARIATELDLLGLRKLRFQGNLTAQGRDMWLLRARLGATVVQPCGITLAPVTTRIEEHILRRFAPEPDASEMAAGVETEMPEDDSLELLGTEIDLRRVMIEALSLALPSYPRAEGAELGQITVTEQGVIPLGDAESKPFAQLAALRTKLQKDE